MKSSTSRSMCGAARRTSGAGRTCVSRPPTGARVVPPGFAHGFLVLSDVAVSSTGARITTSDRNAHPLERPGIGIGGLGPALRPSCRGTLPQGPYRLGLPAVKVVITGRTDNRPGAASGARPFRVKGLSRRHLDITDATPCVRPGRERLTGSSMRLHTLLSIVRSGRGSGTGERG